MTATPSVPEEELGGDPPCWASQFEDQDDVGEDSAPDLENDVGEAGGRR